MFDSRPLAKSCIGLSMALAETSPSTSTVSSSKLWTLDQISMPQRQGGATRIYGTMDGGDALPIRHAGGETCRLRAAIGLPPGLDRNARIIRPSPSSPHLSIGPDPELSHVALTTRLTAIRRDIWRSSHRGKLCDRAHLTAAKGRLKCTMSVQVPPSRPISH